MPPRARKPLNYFERFECAEAATRFENKRHFGCAAEGWVDPGMCPSQLVGKESLMSIAPQEYHLQGSTVTGTAQIESWEISDRAKVLTHDIQKTDQLTTHSLTFEGGGSMKIFETPVGGFIGAEGKSVYVNVKDGRHLTLHGTMPADGLPPRED